MDESQWVTSQNPQRNKIYKAIQKDSPIENKDEAIRFMISSEENKLSPLTIDKYLRLGKKHTDHRAHDIRNILNLKFNGNDRFITATSTTGHRYHFGPRFKNRQDPESEPGQGMGWQTGMKFIESLKRAELDTDLEIPQTGNEEIVDTDELKKRRKEHTKSLKQAKDNPDLIKDIQSTNERRQVRSLIGLDEAIKEASKGIYKDYQSYLQSGEFYKENMRNIMEIMLPRGGVVSRLKSRDFLPERIAKNLKIYQQYGPYLTLDEKDSFLTEFEAFDEETAIIDMKGHSLRYIHDLQDLAEKNTFEGKPEAMLKLLAQLQTEQPVGAIKSLAAFVQLYNVAKERMDNYQRTITQSEEFEKDYKRGEPELEGKFIDCPKWLGGTNDTIRNEISDSLEGIVKKRGDPFLKNTQRWFQNLHGAQQDMENNVTTMSMREANEELTSIVILERRRKSRDENGTQVIDDRQRIGEEFERENEMTLDDFIDRMDDLYRFSHFREGDWKKEEDSIRQEAEVNLYVPERFETFKGLIPIFRDEFIEITGKELKIVDEYRDLQVKSNVLKDIWVDHAYFSQGKRYISKKGIAQANKVIEEKGERIKQEYDSLERNVERSIGENYHLIMSVPEGFQKSELSKFYRFRIYGSAYEEKEDLKKMFRPSWDRGEKSWYVETQKARIAEKLELVRQYNQDHKGKLRVKIE